MERKKWEEQKRRQGVPCLAFICRVASVEWTPVADCVPRAPWEQDELTGVSVCMRALVNCSHLFPRGQWR